MDYAGLLRSGPLLARLDAGPWRGRIQPQPLLLYLCRPLYTLEMKESRVTRVSHFEACDVSFYSL